LGEKKRKTCWAPDPERDMIFSLFELWEREGQKTYPQAKRRRNSGYGGERGLNDGKKRPMPVLYKKRGAPTNDRCEGIPGKRKGEKKKNRGGSIGRDMKEGRLQLLDRHQGERTELSPQMPLSLRRKKRLSNRGEKEKGWLNVDRKKEAHLYKLAYQKAFP